MQSLHFTTSFVTWTHTGAKHIKQPGEPSKVISLGTNSRGGSIQTVNPMIFNPLNTRNQLQNLCMCGRTGSDKWVPVTTAWYTLRLQMEEWPPIWKVAVNVLNMQSRTADKGWSSSLVVGRGANNPSPQKCIVTKCSCRKPRTWTDTSVRQSNWASGSGMWGNRVDWAGSG